MANQVHMKPTNLIHGANLISRYLRFCLVPNGLAYNFEPGPDYKPEPLHIGVALLCLLPLPGLALVQVMSGLILSRVNKHSYEYKAISSSTFVWRMAQILRVYRVIAVVSNLIITLSSHGRVSSVIATENNYLTKKEQSRFAKLSFMFFYLNSAANTLAYSAVIGFILGDEFNSKPQFYLLLLCMSSFMFWVRLTNCATLVYTCYMGACLGRHVKNFSTKYIDSMFDQFMKTIEEDEREESAHSGNAHERIRAKSEREEANSSDHPEAHQISRNASPTIWGHLISVVAHVLHIIRKLIVRLNSRRYPELLEMKMSKLSSTIEIRIGESAHRANNHLIYERLRRTQTMISDMRDLVSSINRVSSPIIIIYVLFETMFLVFIITASVQARVFRSLNILIVPSISVTISVVSSVVCVCIFCDDATKQLKLLTNKLFDFIIMNNRVKSNDDHRNDLGRSSEESSDSMDPEMAALNETWAQFQYTRKLADTIQFTMGGIFPVTRRLVLSVLGHVLSATFISIEIMSIVDTLNMPKAAYQFNVTSRSHHHHSLDQHRSKFEL